MNCKKEIIERIKARNNGTLLYHRDIPVEFQDDKEVIKTERANGMRETERIGFDVINQVYFVHERILDYDSYYHKELWRKQLTLFYDFGSYYNYLNGEIYNNACYYQCDLSTIKKRVNRSRMKENRSFILENINDYSISPSDEELFHYREGVKRKKEVKRWVNKFIACNSLEKLQKTAKAYESSKLYIHNNIDVMFFFWMYIFYDISNENRFKVIMEYMSTGSYPERRMIKQLCHVYKPEDVLENYHYSCGTKQTCYKYKKRLKEYVESLIRNDSEDSTNVYFDEKTHYYCVKDTHGVHRYFETFAELMRHRNYDISNTDLTRDFDLEYDFSNCKTNENTKLPIGKTDDLEYDVEKGYDGSKYLVKQTWRNKNKAIVKQYKHNFEYFFDFVAFLKGDLSGANLLLCEGLKNLRDVSDINFTDAMIRSEICDILGIEYKGYSVDLTKVNSFSQTKECEKSTAPVLLSSREIINSDRVHMQALLGNDFNRTTISYMTDLHLLHKIKDYKAKSLNDVIYVILKIVQTIVNETAPILLIGGDVSSDFTIFEMFIRLLHEEFEKNRKFPIVIFTLGNHELWEFPLNSFNSIVERYNKTIMKYGMYLLQNDIIYRIG